MSGPKVVRVVTKQEVMAICRDQINAVQDVIQQWKKCASNYDVLSVEDEKVFERKLFAINKMFENEQFMDVQKQCAAEIISLRADMDRIRDEAIEKATYERSMRRRLQYSAETLARTFEVASCHIPKELSNIITSALTATESELVSMNTQLSLMLTEFTLSSVEKESMTSLQKELSKKLAEGERLHTLAEWKISHAADGKVAEVDLRLDKLLAEIEAIETEVVAKPFLDRVALIAKELSPNHRSLLTDSLIFDLVAHANNRKIKDQTITNMRETRCKLLRLESKQAKDVVSLLTKAIDSEDVSLSEALCSKGDALLKAEAKSLTGISRRDALLKGLAELGYEVRENMATAWAEDGRIVVRKSNEKEYGVELGAAEDAERVQMQLVSFEQSSDAINGSRDLDRETIWCSEFSRLRSLLEKSGTDLHIEKALPVGSKPLKKVQESSTFLSRERKSRGSTNNKKMQD